MEFINRISHSVFFAIGAGACKLRWIAIIALVAAVGLANVNPHPEQAGRAVEVRGEAANRRLKHDGSSDSLAVAPASANDAQPVNSLTTSSGTVQLQKLTSADGTANNHFGTAVALSSDTLVIGAPDNNGIADDQGSVYVFARSGATWTLQQKLTAQDGAANSGFGFSIAISGDTIVAGAPLDDIGTNVDQGSAYVFTRNGTVWTQQQKLTAQDGTSNDFFGLSVAVSGETVAVTAFGDDIGGNENQGSAYVFTRSNTTWTQQQKLMANDGATGQFFGRSVALSGDTVVVGDNINQIGANFDQGSAYVFFRNGTVWTQQQKLTADDGEEGDQFGLSLAISGDTIVVGAPDDDTGGNFDLGSVYVFVRHAANWTQQQKLMADDGASVDFFGSAVALSGDTIVVGAENDEIGEIVGNLGQGSAYVFARSGTVWAQHQKLLADDGASVDRFGSAVAISADTVVVGSPLDDVGANKDQGSAYVFVLPGCFLSVAPVNFAFPPQGGNGIVNVSAGEGCAWTAVSNDPLLTVTAGVVGNGSGIVTFAVSANPNPDSRCGTLTVAGHQVRVVQAAPMACVSAASLSGGALPAESIVAAFGTGLALSTEVATTQPLPVTLAGAKVSVIDSQGMERFAPLFFVSPTQINFQVPPGTVPGRVLVMVIRDGQTVAAASPPVETVAPGFFSANANGQGVATGVVLRFKADGSQSFEPLARFDQATQQFVAVPINLDSATDNVFLVLFGTGLRNRSSLSTVGVKIGGVNVDALYAGPQGSFVGLDQVNVSLPRSLAGRGEVDVNVTVDGVAANHLKVAVK
ncbi:MAG: hypothetical protein JST85_12930 [Acidobacteria bacterium]|nr:hypothetical protein [Acidobacteriota bacterium]